MIKIYLLFFFSILSCVELSAQQNNILLLEDILKYDYLKSSDAKKSKLQYEQVELNIENFTLSKLPTIGVDLKPMEFSQSIVSLQDPESGNFNYINSFVNRSNIGLTVVQPINLTGGNLEVNSSLNMMNEFSLNRNTFSTTPISISYYQPMVGGRKKYIFERDIMQYTQKKMTSDFISSHYTIQHRCVELYMAVLSADIALENSRLNFVIADTVHQFSEMKYSVREITELEFIQSEIQLEQSNSKVINNEIQRDKAMRELLVYLNMDDKHYSVITPKINFASHIDIDQAISDVTAHNSKFIEIEKLRIEADRDLYNAKSQTTFNGDLRLSYGLNQYGNQLISAYQNPSAQQMISIGMRIPLIDWGVKKNNYKLAKLRYESTIIDISDREIDIYKNLQITVDAYNYSTKMLGIAERQFDLSRRQYQLVVDNFKSSLSSFFELATARTQLLDSEEAYLNELSQTWINYYKVRAITLSDYE